MTNLHRQWIGRRETVNGFVTGEPFRRLATSFGWPVPDLPEGCAMPALTQWLIFLGATHRSDTGEDGHPIRGVFLPPIELTRRMFAGGRVSNVQPFRVGDSVSRHGVVKNIEEKLGKSGPLVIVTIRYEIFGETRLVMTEEQDLVFTSSVPTRPSNIGSQPPDAPWQATVETDEILLFRFSALTFNSHRIHYDRDYARDTEGYPDLVVHGPLSAMALADLVRQNSERTVTAFSFRARAPLYVGDAIHMRGWPANHVVRLQAFRSDGLLAVEAMAELQ